jgi:tetratricopeptide (TPR) repeat protein
MKYLRLLTILGLSILTITSKLFAAEYVAFSLKVAQKRIEEAGNADWRKNKPEVFYLGGITAIRGLVYDQQAGDVILVGERDPERALLALDDFVVALRARFIHSKWPLVSIDPTHETEKTEMQIVRFEGGIEATQFGEDLFDADYRLKRIGMGLLHSGIPSFKIYWDLGMEKAKEGTGGSHKISSRFWFYPVLPSVAVREDVVAIKGLKVGVFTEVLSAEIDGKKIEDLSTFQDVTGDEFAKAVSEKFEELSKVHPSFLRLQGLDELVALTKAIEEMDKRPDCLFWLKDYKVKQVRTMSEVEVLTRKEAYEVPVSGGIYQGYLEVSGGVQLMAIALRLKAGDVTALKEAVLKTRPKPDALTWSFVVGEWLIPTTPGMLQVEDVVPLFTQAVFLQENKRYDDAITTYGKIIELKSDWDFVYNNRGGAYGDKGERDRSISDFNKAIEINPRYASAYYNRGNTYDDKGEYDRSISDFNKAIEINPRFAEAYNNRGNAYCHKGEYDQAISDFDKAIEINPRDAEAYNNRGNAYDDKGEYDQAISDYNKALEVNPRYAEAYYNRGNAYDDKGEYDQAISDFNKAIEINLRNAEAYNNRAVAYHHKGEYDQAISDYNKALEVNPRYAEAYYNRGNAYDDKGEYDRSISDFNKAIEISPRYASAYLNRGIAYRHKGEYDQAISDYNKVLEINPRYAEAYANRAVAYYFKGEYDNALRDVYKAQDLGCQIQPKFLELLHKASGKER